MNMTTSEAWRQLQPWLAFFLTGLALLFAALTAPPERHKLRR